MSRKDSDEAWIIDVCDKVLGLTASRQHTFPFLVGDTGRKLPVDAYYEKLNLVIEYREKQHTESVPHFDKRMTVSGVHRGEQRKLYDQRRRDVLSKHGIQLVELAVADFRHSARMRLDRDSDDAERVIQMKLANWIALSPTK
ncbi:MAG: hypothetical protein IT449_11510 [Phycisphaerales bacterium]|nr:hypothetical protein [Phycisphaerales bacterium]